MTADEVLAIARAGAAAGCHEALFTLGDKPELRYRVAREELAALGLRDHARVPRAHVPALVLEETGLLPHANPGVMSVDELRALREVSASQGIMLETTSERLVAARRPALRLARQGPGRAPRDASRPPARPRVPFTSGILIGIGETRAERLEALLALRALAERHGHLQEAIVQNFRAKPDTKMAGARRAGAGRPPAGRSPWRASCCRRRCTVQAPPNLHAERPARAARRGHRRLGRRLARHARPRQPRGAVARARAPGAGDGERRATSWSPRLAVHPGYVADARPTGCAPAVRTRRAAPRRRRRPGPRRTAGPRVATTTPPRTWLRRVPGGRRRRSRPRSRRAVAARSWPRTTAVALLRARAAPSLRAVLRRRRRGCGARSTATSSPTSSRGTSTTPTSATSAAASAPSRRAARPRTCAARRTSCRSTRSRAARAEAWDRGATEVCLQGGIHPAFTGDFYLDVVRAVKDAVPDMHVHAFSPLEVWQGAATLGLPHRATTSRGCATPASASLPGTAAEILDDEVRAVHLPGQDLHGAVARGDATRRTASGCARRRRSCSAHVERPLHWARHLLALRELQRRTGGFTEFVPLPFVHMEAPIYLKRPRAAGADLPRGDPDARGRPPGAAPVDHERAGLVGQARPRGRGRGAARGRATTSAAR